MGLLDFRPPTSLRMSMANAGESWDHLTTTAPSQFMLFKKTPHDSHPPLAHLILLIFGAVLEVVCVSLPGYIIARLGHFDADKQKFLANLNVMLFTPCLIFTKLASQLNADKLLDLGVIPVIFIIQTLVSYVVATGVAKCFGFNKRASNFVTAMGVFGNSNSLPISLVLSLSQTLKGLHWDKIRGDNDDEVGARGILYLMIFQQLGQLVRWSWGYHVLLAPKDKYEEYNEESVEEGRYRGDTLGETHEQAEAEGLLGSDDGSHGVLSQSDESDVYEPAGKTPVGGASRTSPNDSEDDEHDTLRKRNGKHALLLNGNPDGSLYPGDELDRILSFPRIRTSDEPEAPAGIKGLPMRAKSTIKKSIAGISTALARLGNCTFNALPQPFQALLVGVSRVWSKFYTFLWEFMNPPLWAMLVAVLVASVPDLQNLFFQDESFINTSVTSAISSSAGVAVPLILVVLGANLARNTQPKEDEADPEEKALGTKLLVASLISRMVLPTLIMAPILALIAKYVPVSILDDPIFIIVCFLLTGAPSALQLAQICQINNVFETVMGRILFQSYVIWILPSTLVLVMLALEVVEWSK
ncbi:auxin efflux carrier [Podospora didyma]|uniref:Auxin efflux carrier n=1 Tax=Podospora didyma TaxID=330526 RepID=A0AAE0K929_9PEZI|nr:auxin efflux carrier [Podospora didyma]